MRLTGVCYNEEPMSAVGGFRIRNRKQIPNKRVYYKYYMYVKSRQSYSCVNRLTTYF